ncbi:probable hydrolase PNKD [Emydura macquarii macquarii]|uniref:probable hydrolase PNKD n=1 Tax=Emydura macquarii macquarii TaxID=1129001 RepID=UPI00352BABD4
MHRGWARCLPGLRRTVCVCVCSSRAGATSGVMAAAGRWLRGFFSAALSRAACVAVTRRPLAQLSARLLHGGGRAPLELRAKPEPGRRLHGVPAFTSKRKDKNAMKIIALAWAVGFPSGITLFVLTKRQVDKNRLKQLKSRQKMKESNVGDYTSERYKRTSVGPVGMTNTKA